MSAVVSHTVPPARPVTSHGPTRAALAALVVSTALAVAGCGDKPGAGGSSAGGASGASGASAGASGAAAAAPGPAGSAPPVGVTTVRAQQRDLPVLITATGTVAPLASVDVRAQTTSVVTQVHVKEGQFVQKGTLLFTLDARADEANVAKARAQVAKDEAALADARRQLTRSKELLGQGFVSQGALDANQALFDSAQALVSADRAALDATRVALGYSRITAPSAGRLGAINVYPGSSVQANTTALVSVTQLDPITVAFALPQRHLADALAALKNGGADVSATPPESEGQGVGQAGGPAAGASAARGAGQSAGSNAARTTGALQGKLKFVDNAVDAATGSVRVKAQFDNPDGRLWPGAFVNVAMTARVLKGAVVVPQAAIIQSARGPLVYAVQDGKAQPRPLQLLYAQGDDAAVSGVRPGERIVLDGRQNLRPGAVVVERSGGGGRGGAASGAASGAPGGNRSAPGAMPGKGNGNGNGGGGDMAAAATGTGNNPAASSSMRAPAP